MKLIQWLDIQLLFISNYLKFWIVRMKYMHSTGDVNDVNLT